MLARLENARCIGYDAGGVVITAVHKKFILVYLSFLCIGVYLLADQIIHRPQVSASEATASAAKISQPAINNPILPGINDQELSKPQITPQITPTPLGTMVNAARIIRVPVLNYHYIRYMFNPEDKMGYDLSVPPTLFEQQMDYLKANGYTTITPQDLYNSLFSNKSLPGKPVLLTFDDGYQDFYSEANRVLAKYGMKATIFIPTDLIGKPNYLTWDQLNALSLQNNITVGGHTRTHADLPKLPQDKIDDEVINGRAILEKHIGKPVQFFAYPYGTFSRKAIAAVQKAGYQLAFSTLPGKTHSQDQRYFLHRVNVNGREDLAQFIASLTN